MYREVTMIEVREVLRLRGAGPPEKRIAAQLGLDPKTVRRYLEAAAARRVPRAGVDQRRGGPRRAPGAASGRRSAARRRLGALCRAARGDRAVAGRRPPPDQIRKLLVRQGVDIAYPTLHRFAVLELHFGKTATTIPVIDGEPGHELQVDTGWVGWLTLPPGEEAAVSGVDLHRGPVTPSFRLPHVRRDDGARHRGV